DVVGDGLCRFRIRPQDVTGVTDENAQHHADKNNRGEFRAHGLPPALRQVRKLSRNATTHHAGGNTAPPPWAHIAGAGLRPFPPPRSGAAAPMPRCAAQQSCAAEADSVDRNRPSQSLPVVASPSAWFSKFVILRGTLGHELRKPKGTSNSMILVPLFDLKFLRRTRGTRCRNCKSAALAFTLPIRSRET